MKFNKAKQYIEKINENIDKAQDYRNKMALKSLASIAAFVGCYFAHSYETMNWLLYIVQFCSVFYTIYTGAVALFITYVEFMVVSKVEAVSFGKGMGRVVVDQTRDMAVDTVRNLKTDNKKT